MQTPSTKGRGVFYTCLGVRVFMKVWALSLFRTLPNLCWILNRLSSKILLTIKSWVELKDTDNQHIISGNYLNISKTSLISYC